MNQTDDAPLYQGVLNYNLDGYVTEDPELNRYYELNRGRW